MKQIKIPKYNTEDFYNFAYGVDVHNDEINQWISDGMDYIKNNPKEAYYSIGSGNTTVIILNLLDEYSVIVTKNYQEATIYKEV